MTWASSASVLASRPVARAKSRIWRGLTTASGRPAPARAAATVISNPPVASSTIRAGARVTQIVDELLKTFAVARDGKGLA